MAKKKETFEAAHTRLLTGLGEAGWIIRPWLKVPWAKPSSGPEFTLFFRAQAVYLNEHSLWIDVRGMSLETFLQHVKLSYDFRSV